jgi:hypothetical protein
VALAVEVLHSSARLRVLWVVGRGLGETKAPLCGVDLSCYAVTQPKDAEQET